MQKDWQERFGLLHWSAKYPQSCFQTAMLYVSYQMKHVPVVFSDIKRSKWQRSKAIKKKCVPSILQAPADPCAGKLPSLSLLRLP